MSALARDRRMTPALEFVNISKRFGAVKANRGVCLSIGAGSIHGIVGENGAGKSTLMSILFGERRADAGEVRVNGRRVTIASPRDALGHGVGMVHQHFMLIEAMSVLDNIMLGAEGGALLSAGRARMRQKLDGLAREHGLAINADALIGDLPVGLRQRVEILKALTRDVRILALDEPTSVLTPDEAAELFQLMRRLRDAGASLIFITHKLPEALAVTDRISVMRRGEVVAEFATSETSADELAEAMVGRKVARVTRADESAPGAVVFSARDLRVSDGFNVTRVDGVCLDLRAGEIVGLAGVSGNGQSELLEALACMRPSANGVIAIDGVALDKSQANPRSLRAMGIVHAPEDRTKHGLVLDFPACESAMLGFQHERRYGAALLDPDAITADCAGVMARWNITPNAPALATRGLSGGNQQKLVLAREIERNPRVLLVGQPTRGVDVGAIESIHTRLLALRAAGKAILIVSSELDEILALADRIIVMCNGRIIGERRAHETNARELGLMMAGVTEAAR